MAKASYPELTFGFEAAAHLVANEDELLKAFEPLANRVGATRYLCAYLGEDVSGKTVRHAIANIPREWQVGYLHQGYEATDPIFVNITSGGTCGYWDELMPRTDRKGGPPPKVMDYAAKIGMHDGFTKRIMLDAGGVALMMVGGRQLDRSQEARTALRLSAQVFANEGARLSPTLVASLANAELEQLSPSQREVLRLRAEGHSNVEVAARVGTVPKTVESHVTQILRRLKARNMIDAIRIAKEMRLLR